MDPPPCKRHRTSALSPETLFTAAKKIQQAFRAWRSWTHVSVLGSRPRAPFCLVEETSLVHCFDGDELLQGLLCRPDFRHPISRRELQAPEIRRLTQCTQDSVLRLLLPLTFLYREPLLAFLRAQDAYQQILEEEIQTSLTRALDVAGGVGTDEQLGLARESILGECCSFMRHLQELLQLDDRAGYAVILLGKARIQEKLRRASSIHLRSLQYLRVAFNETAKTLMGMTLGSLRPSSPRPLFAIEKYLSHVLQRTLRWTGC